MWEQIDQTEGQSLGKTDLPRAGPRANNQATRSNVTRETPSSQESQDANNKLVVFDMWQALLNVTRSEEASTNAHWRETISMLDMRQAFLSGRISKGASANAHWRETIWVFDM